MSISFTAPNVTIERNRYGWPMIPPPGGGKPVPYIRVSKLAKELGDTYNLDQWRKRMVVLGMSRRDDLVTLAKSAKADDKQRLNDIAKAAMEAAESDRAANIGTALHTFTEQVDEGVDIETMPAEYRADMYAYRAALAAAGVEVVAKELFVVNDHVQAAGTFDRLLRLTRGQHAGAIAVGDVKTGASDPSFPHAVCQQIATYAHSHLYDPERGRVGYLPDLGVSTTVGILIHLPQGTGTCTLYELDLSEGWALVRTAAAVREAFKSKPIAPYQP